MDQWQVEIPRQAGLYVRGKREELGFTRSQAAQRAGVSERLLASLELGDAPGIRLDKLLAVLRALGLSLLVTDESSIPEEDNHPPAAVVQEEPSEQQAGTDTPDSARVSYDELYRAFVQRQGIPWLGNPVFEREGMSHGGA